MWTAEKARGQADKEVVDVMLLYCGMVGTAAVHKSLGRMARNVERLPDGVIALAFE